MSRTLGFLEGLASSLGTLVVMWCLSSCDTDACEDIGAVEPYELPVGQFRVVRSEDIDLGSSASVVLGENELSIEYSVADTDSRIRLFFSLKPLIE